MAWEPPNISRSMNHIEIAYKESCDIVRHYSIAVRHIRTLAIAHGVTILGAIAVIFYRIQNPEMINLEMIKWTVVSISIYGLVATIILGCLHDNYLNNFLSQEKTAIKLENKLLCDQKPWYENKKARKDRWGKYNKKYGFVVNKAIYYSLAIAFLIVALIAVMY